MILSSQQFSRTRYPNAQYQCLFCFYQYHEPTDHLQPPPLETLAHDTVVFQMPNDSLQWARTSCLLLLLLCCVMEIIAIAITLVWFRNDAESIIDMDDSGRT